jgi:hypothetical protein
MRQQELRKDKSTPGVLGFVSFVVRQGSVPANSLTSERTLGSHAGHHSFSLFDCRDYVVEFNESGNPNRNLYWTVMLLMSQLSDRSDSYLACQRKRFNQGFDALDFLKGELY